MASQVVLRLLPGIHRAGRFPNGIYNTAGFNDDTRAFCSIPARHDVARRSDCAYLATLVGTGRLREAEAFEVAQDLSYGLAKAAYRL